MRLNFLIIRRIWLYKSRFLQIILYFSNYSKTYFLKICLWKKKIISFLIIILNSTNFNFKIFIAFFSYLVWKKFYLNLRLIKIFSKRNYFMKNIINNIQQILNNYWQKFSNSIRKSILFYRMNVNKRILI